MDDPLRLDVAGLVARAAAPRRRATWRLGLGVVLAGLVVIAAGAVAYPRLIAGPASSQAANGSTQHFEANSEAFDYPSNWHLIAQVSQGNLMEYVLAVVGTGSWHQTCGATGCSPDTFDVSGSQIVVKVYQTHQIGPVTTCEGSDADATFGTVAVRQTGTATDQIWEIRRPSSEFGAVNNLWVEARTDDPAEMARAEALVATIHWSDNSIPGPDCWSPGPSAS